MQVCKHNPSVDCTNTAKCKKCGWNPAVCRERQQNRKAFKKENVKRVMFGKVSTPRGDIVNPLTARIIRTEDGDVFKIEHAATKTSFELPLEKVNDLISKL